VRPVLEALARLAALGPEEGLGGVVLHRAQRAALHEVIPCLSVWDDATGAIRLSSVDTVERFQGDERVAIVYRATESDPQYLVSASKFLLDPRRLTVALSRAKRKIIGGIALGLHHLQQRRGELPQHATVEEPAARDPYRAAVA
jgi:hypothetical protein